MPHALDRSKLIFRCRPHSPILHRVGGQDTTDHQLRTSRHVDLSITTQISPPNEVNFCKLAPLALSKPINTVPLGELSPGPWSLHPTSCASPFRGHAAQMPDACLCTPLVVNTHSWWRALVAIHVGRQVRRFFSSFWLGY